MRRVYYVIFSERGEADQDAQDFASWLRAEARLATVASEPRTR